MRTLILALAVSLIDVMPASGQSKPPLVPVIADDQTSLEFQLTLGAWFPRLGGDVTLGSGDSISLDLEPDLGLDDSETAFNIEFQTRFAKGWQIDLSGFDFDTDSDNVFEGTAQFGALALDPGDAFTSTFDMTSVSVGLSHWWFRPFSRGVEDSRVDLWFSPGAGFRWIDVDQSLEIPGEGSERAGGEWLSPYLSIDLLFRYDVAASFPIVDRLEISGRAEIGPALGGDGGIASHIRATITAYVTENIGVSFGYRLLEMDVENDDFEFSGGLQGLFAGVSITF